MNFLPGDIQFVYNHSILHDRTSYIDWKEDNKKRHLLRLWLSLPNDRPLPTSFAKRYGSLEIGNRGGIVTHNTKFHVQAPKKLPKNKIHVVQHCAIKDTWELWPQPH